MLIFRIGVKHHSIVQLIDQLDCSDEPNSDKVARRRGVERLAELWVDCIFAEEQLMRNINYSQYRDHSSDHHKLFSVFSATFVQCDRRNGAAFTTQALVLKKAFLLHAKKFDDPLFELLPALSASSNSEIVSDDAQYPRRKLQSSGEFGWSVLGWLGQHATHFPAITGNRSVPCTVISPWTSPQTISCNPCISVSWIKHNLIVMKSSAKG